MQQVKGLNLRAEFSVWGQHYEKIMFGLRGLRFGEDFEINVEEGCMMSMQDSVDFG